MCCIDILDRECIEDATWKDGGVVGYLKSRTHGATLGFAVGVIAFPLSIGVNLFVQGWIPEVKFLNVPGKIYSDLVNCFPNMAKYLHEHDSFAACVFAPFAEETLWRFAIQGSTKYLAGQLFNLSRQDDSPEEEARVKKMTKWFAILFSGITFGGTHHYWAQKFSAMFGGLLYAWLKEETGGNMVVPIAGHVTHNVLCTIPEVLFG